MVRSSGSSGYSPDNAGGLCSCVSADRATIAGIGARGPGIDSGVARTPPHSSICAWLQEWTMRQWQNWLCRTSIIRNHDADLQCRHHKRDDEYRCRHIAIVILVARPVLGERTVIRQSIHFVQYIASRLGLEGYQQLTRGSSTSPSSCISHGVTSEPRR